MGLGIAFHLDLALQLLNAGSVFNVTFMEGKPVMMETTRKGHALTISVADFVAANMGVFDDAEAVQAFAQETDQTLSRAQMLELAATVLPPDWEEHIGAKPLHGTLELGNPMRCSFFLYSNMDHRQSKTAADVTPPEQVPFKSGYRGMLGCAVRILPTEPMDLKKLRLDQGAISVADVKGGMVLVVGSPGVGKSTTAAAYVDHVNRTRSGSIVTAENPIEVPIRSKASVVSQREVGVNVASVRMALRDAERNFAHSAFIGEIQTMEDELEAFASARHGLFVVATSFANDAVDAIKTLVTNIDKTGSNGADLVSGTLLAVVYQVRLPSTQEGKWEFAYETLVIYGNEEVVRFIRNRDWAGLVGKVTGDNSTSLNGSLAELVVQKRVLREAATLQAYDKRGLTQLLEGVRR